MREALAPGGVLAVNLVTVVDGRDGAPWRATLKTLARVFPNARAFQASAPNDGLANVLLFASDGPLDAPAAAVAPGARADAKTMLAQELLPARAELDAAPVMTDDHAPLDSLLAPTAARWRAMLQQRVGEVLLR